MKLIPVLEQIEKSQPDDFTKTFHVELIREAGLSPYDPKRDLYGEERIFMNQDEGICQNPWELANFIWWLKTMNCKNMLEIGSGHGWTSTFIHHVMKKFNKDFKTKSIDINPKSYLPVSQISGVEFANCTSNEIKESFEAVFIDANHSYEWAKSDYEAIGKKAKVCGFHDIDDVFCPGVQRLWEEVSFRTLHRQFVSNPGKLGIGISFKLPS